MGTHALIKFRTIDNGQYKVYMVIYFQFDGYPEGIVKDLIKFIESKKMVNGYGCFLAQYIARFKDGAGNMYVYPIDTVMNEQFNYILTYDEQVKKFTISMNQGPYIDIDKFMDQCKDNTDDDDDDDVNSDDDNSDYSDYSINHGRNSANYK